MLDNSRSSAQVRSWVTAELDWDPKVDGTDITVSADGGAVTLRGSVARFWQVREASNATQRVYGVTSVSNHLTVRSRDSEHMEDREVRAAVLHALLLHKNIPTSITAEVDHGLVRLTGTATWRWQRDEAEYLCAAVAGVTALRDDIELTPAPADAEIQHAIMAAFRRNARLTLDDLSVDVLRTGVVILSGTVTSWAEHDEAVAAGWSAPGVARVYDRITVTY
jgi:osmotically-inducible protein OsmY